MFFIYTKEHMAVDLIVRDPQEIVNILNYQKSIFPQKLPLKY